MSDPFSAERLPDLPNAGYATTNEKTLSDMIMVFIRKIERDRVRLLTIVIEGREKWRQVSGDIWRGLPIDTDLKDAIFDYFQLLAAPARQRVRLLEALQNPAVVRDVMRELLPELERQREQLQLMQKWAP